MIKNIRIVQDHGWIQQPDGRLEWAPTQFWIEVQNGLNEWQKLEVFKINELPRDDDPLYDRPHSH